MSLRRSLLVVVLVAVLPGSGRAADKKPENGKVPPRIAEMLQLPADDFIRRLDKNKNGFVDKDELPPRLAAAFNRFDLNGDGKLDRDEVDAMLRTLRKRFGVAARDSGEPAAAKGKPGQPKTEPGKTEEASKQGLMVERIVDEILSRMDTDKDGRVSRGEARNKIAENFDALDTNKDGFLDRAELRRAAQQYLAMQGRQADGKPAPASRFPSFDSLDLDADGRLTREEVKGSMIAEHFDEIDTNKDGKIDPKEYASFLRKQKD